MSRTKLLLDVVTDLQNLAESIQTIAEVLASNEEHHEQMKSQK
ncbi:hypothetical protein [Pseudogracilibacillus auburnensis]|nr:hypothetical protein [Pseudogracilibacillus auburnensis]